MEKYIGFKLIQAMPAARVTDVVHPSYISEEGWPIPKDAKIEDGYKVVYPDGYVSWSPKEIFEAAYMKVGDNCTITQENVDYFIVHTETTTIGEKTTLVRATLANGFEIIESSSCVDPQNYDEKFGEEICKAKIKDKVWNLLGFLLQTAKNGIK